MARHKRNETVYHVDVFVDETSKMHSALQKYLRDLRPSGAHYASVLKLSDAIRVAIEEVSGKPAPWMMSYTSKGPPVPGGE